MLASKVMIMALLSMLSVKLCGSQYNLMQNLNPLEWKHVQVHSDKIHTLAQDLVQKDQLTIADWTEILPEGLDTKEYVEYILGLICIDFCHWDFKPHEKGIRNFYDPDMQVRGSAAMTALAKNAYQSGVKIFDAAYMEKVSVHDLRSFFMGVDDGGNRMEIPWLEERVKVLNEVGLILRQKWDGSFYNVLLKAEGRAFNQGKGFVELLVRDFPRFRDEYIYKGHKIGIYKLAQLSVMALQSSLRQHSDFPAFKDCETLTLCADYQLPKALRALGILEYGTELKNYVDQEKMIPYGSDLEVELRMATVFAGEMLKKTMNDILTKKGMAQITALELDYLLWSRGRELDSHTHKHHLTVTTMY